ncbi:hypothetical protein JOC36_001747 [Weissella uvarum]|nr:hypothetical protein [Weissella uvarum]MBM7618143.1 hypothetical protein [Weissella uvarum]MCM0595240.1 hypothetical protein [Weissella uvarum]
MNNNLNVVNKFEHLEDDKLININGGRNKLAYNIGKTIGRIIRRVR